MADSSVATTHAEALQTIIASGIINPDLKLKDLVSLSQKISGLSKKGSENPDDVYCFIHSNFVVFHKD